MRKRFCYLLFFLIITIINTPLFAQSYNMLVNGYTEIHTDSGTLYDDGGASGNYSIRVNAKTTIYPNSPNAKIIINGSFNLEHYNKTKLRIYSGDTNSNKLLFSNQATPLSGIISVTSLEGPVTVYFFVDSDNPKSGFELNISICNNCPPSPRINAEVINDSTALISWTNPNDYNGNWIVEYTNNCLLEKGSGIRLTTSDTSIILTSLAHCDLYGVLVYTPCDTLENSCPQPIHDACWIQCECAVPISASAISKNDTLIASWTYSDTATIEWTVILTLNDTIIDSIVTTNLRQTFTGLEPLQCYIVSIFQNCHNVPFDEICKMTQAAVCTPCPCPMVLDLNYIIVQDSITFSWNEPSDTIEWIIELYSEENLLTTITTNDTIAIFNNLQPATPYNVRIYTICNEDSIICPISLSVVTSCKCPKAQKIKVENISNGYALISWDNNPSSPGWIVEYKKKGTTTSNFLTTFTNSITIPITQNAAYYEMWVHSLCDSLNPACANKIEFINVETIGNCLNYTDLKSVNVSAKYGTYQYPYQNSNLIDYGYLSINSRHTVHYDTAQRDERTNNALRTIPEGEMASVRLGNWRDGAQAESLTYRYEVDTNNFDLMILKYAIVLQDPEHTPSNQPRFILEVLNNNDQLIDSVCGYANFIASGNLGWNTVAGSNVIWKDWTTIGFDIAQYHGQVIKVRLTTFDCKDGGHYGYAYYTLKCSTKMIKSSACGDTDTNIFSAPEGFNYKWYSTKNSNNILSTSRTFNAPSDSSQHYYCVVSSKENPNCKFIINTYAGIRYPLAAFSYTSTWQDCTFEVKFQNESKISSDGINPIIPETKCENIQWIFDDGDIQYIDNPVKYYSSSGEYIIKLVAGLADNKCTDTLEIVLNLVSPNGILKIVGDSSLCIGESTTLTATIEGTYKWNTGQTTQSISLTPTKDSLYFVQVIDTSGCSHFAERMIRVHPHYNNVVVYDTACDNFIYDAQGTILTQSGTYNLNLTSVYGCDSNIILHLIINPAFFDTSHVAICNNETFNFHGLELDSTGFYQVVFTNEYGCDSIYSVFLSVYPAYNDTIYGDIYKGNTFNRFGFNETTTGFYTHNLQTINGCDSIIHLDLQVDNVMFPNVVTPNGDGINDNFEIHNLIEQNAFPENELTIFTRYGKQIYYFKNISKKEDFWSPTQTNTPTGTYFYRFKGRRHDKTIDTIGVIEVLK